MKPPTSTSPLHHPGSSDGETKASSRPGRRLGLAHRPAGRAERSHGSGRESARPSAPQVKQGPGGGQTRWGPRAASPGLPRPLSHILRPCAVDAWSQPQVGAARCAAPPPSSREREKKPNICVYNALSGPQLQAQGEERQGGGGDPVTGDDSLRRQGNRLSCRDQEGRRGSEEAVPGPSVFPSGDPGVSGDFSWRCPLCRRFSLWSWPALRGLENNESSTFRKRRSWHLVPSLHGE